MADHPDSVLTPAVREALSRSVLCWLATTDADGRPNVSPKELFVAASDDRLLIADIASPTSVRNLAANPHVCVAAVDVFDQRGVQLYGRARLIERDDAAFASDAAPLLALAGEHFVVRRLIEVTVERTRPIVAPSYWARPELSDAERRASALAGYGVHER